ncbi:MAG: hypothetical protein JWQ97_1005 [Phenylobacterium sp.]|nr:hypothetical protein [Phenylobacterium sp.]
MRLSKAAQIIPILFLAACATSQGPEPKVVVQRVEVPVAVRCSVDPGPDPTFADTADALRQAADLFERVKLLLAGRDQRDARLSELRAANAGCK